MRKRMEPLWWGVLAAEARPLKISAVELNARFSTFGVFSHQFDDSQDLVYPWLVNLTARKFTSLSIASASFPYFYSTSLGGVLLSSEFVLNSTEPPVTCACTCDCNSDSRGPTGCSNISQLSGSLPEDNGCHESDKTIPSTAYRTVDDMLVRLDPKPNARCIWTPLKPYDNKPANIDPQGRVRPPPGETLLEHFSCKYNEIVLDGARYNGAMPAAVDAFFFTVNCWRDPRAHLITLPTSAAEVGAVRDHFLAHYAPSLPAPGLFSLDCGKLARREPPWADAGERMLLR